MRAKTVSESIDFERGQDPKRAMGLGLPPKYPQLSTKEFKEWFNREIDPYYDTIGFDDDFDFEGLLSDFVNDEESTDAELREEWDHAPKDLVEKMIHMRPYFLDFRYVEAMREF